MICAESRMQTLTCSIQSPASRRKQATSSLAVLDSSEGKCVSAGSVPEAEKPCFSIITISYIVRLLILRGETNIRVLDLAPPPRDLASHPALTYAKVDITSPPSVRAALLAPFPSGTLPSVIFHTAATIRFWERAGYTFDASYRVNVLGTAVVLAAAKELLPKDAIVVYTSSADVVTPAPRFLQLGRDYRLPPWNKITIGDDDAPLSAEARPTSNYAQSKIMAERLVFDANSPNGLRTGCLRPGQCV
jgi:nucleoside-diphosphate-sugar epimerase